MNIKNLIEKLPLLLIFLLSVFAILPFFANGFFSFHDDVQIARIYEMAKSLSAGMFPVRVVQDLGYGYGYPIFNFYSVLPYYFGGFLAGFGLNIIIAAKTVFIFGILLSLVSMYFLAKAFFGKIPAVVAALVYLYFPYHAVNIYVRGDLAELFAYAFFPLVFLSLFKTHTSGGTLRESRFYVLLGALSTTAVILSHNLSAFMLFIFIAAFIFASVAIGKNKKELILSYLLMLFSSFLLSSFYAIPTILEMKYTNVLSQVGGGSHYADHFICIGQLWDSLWGFGGSAPGCIDGMSFKLGKLNIILMFIAAALFIFTFNKNRKHKTIVSAAFVFLCFSIFMTTNYSVLIWNLPFMDFLQFPWRFLNFVGLFISFLVGFLIFIVGQKSVRGVLIISVIIVTITLFLNVRLFVPKEHLNVLSSSYTNQEYLNWTASKISDEYLPKYFKKPGSAKDIRKEPVDIVRGNGEIEVKKHAPGSISSSISLKNDSFVRLNIAYFPAWRVFLDGKSVGYRIGNDGLYLNVSSGRHTLDARFIETGIERISNLMTLIGVFLLLAVIIGKLDFLYGKKAS